MTKATNTLDSESSRRRLAVVSSPDPTATTRRPAVAPAVDLSATLLPPAAEPSEESAPPAADLRVGDLARLTGKTVRALHLYEELGLLEPAHRSKGGYRLYRADSQSRVEWIARLQDIGFSLPDIRGLLDNWAASDSAPRAMTELRALYARKLEETRAQLKKLHELEGQLDLSLAYLATCGGCEPERTVTACPACDRHDCSDTAPVLVAGLHAH